MHASFCIEALEEAITKHAPPEIMNSDQGSQFTGADWITMLTGADVRGHYLDNIVIERLWRSLRTELAFTILRDLIQPLNTKHQWKHTGPTKMQNKRHEI